MLALNPLVDNTEIKLEDAYKKIVPEHRGFGSPPATFISPDSTLYEDDPDNLIDPDELGGDSVTDSNGPPDQREDDR